MSFGFSVGDFIAALEVVGVVIDALRAGGKAARQYRELLKELWSLKLALLAVQTMDIDESLCAYESALRITASQCLGTISDFWERMQKYQLHLRLAGSGSKIISDMMKIKWALCESDDIIKFQSDIMGHTAAIQMLIGMIQM